MLDPLAIFDVAIHARKISLVLIACCLFVSLGARDTLNEDLAIKIMSRDGVGYTPKYMVCRLVNMISSNNQQIDHKK